ncbi:unnamed protein product [Owenia fusiformis]|uniref:Uncharacterized protein n=1 Tax=Owenia fusiformis TaxID=6347 RepID=A0A8J1UD12_OWEFU|nr:unnamed protein product [Owenia fusiformis]
MTTDINLDMRTFVILALCALAVYENIEFTLVLAQEPACTCIPPGNDTDICIGTTERSCRDDGGRCLVDPDPFGDNNPCPDGFEPAIWVLGDCCDPRYEEAHTCCTLVEVTTTNVLQ